MFGNVRTRLDNLVNIVLNGKISKEGHGRIGLSQTGQFGRFVVDRTRHGIFGCIQSVRIRHHRRGVIVGIVLVSNGSGKAQTASHDRIGREKASKGCLLGLTGILFVTENVVPTGTALAFVCLLFGGGRGDFRLGQGGSVIEQLIPLLVLESLVPCALCFFYFDTSKALAETVHEILDRNVLLVPIVLSVIAVAIVGLRHGGSVSFVLLLPLLVL